MSDIISNINPSSGSGTQQVTFTISSTNGRKDRSQTATATVSGISPATISITRTGRPPYLNLTYQGTSGSGTSSSPYLLYSNTDQTYILTLKNLGTNCKALKITDSFYGQGSIDTHSSYCIIPSDKVNDYKKLFKGGAIITRHEDGDSPSSYKAIFTNLSSSEGVSHGLNMEGLGDEVKKTK